jgi:hypothetical protein
MKLWVLACAIAAVGTAGALQARIIEIDDFSADQSLIWNHTGPGQSPGIDIGRGTRTLEINGLPSRRPVQHQIDTGLNPDTNKGELDITNGSQDDARVTITYNLQPLPIPVGATDIKLFLDVVASDGNPIQLQVKSPGGSNVPPQVIPRNTTDTPLTFDLGSDLRSGGRLALVFDGLPAWDLTLQSLGVSFTPRITEIPAPATWVLLAIGAIAASVGLRRTIT